MLFRTHFVFAVLLSLFFVKYLELSFIGKIIFVIFFFFATVFVDIDSTKSKIGNFWFLRPFQWFISHRGMIHSLMFGVILSFIFFLIYPAAGIGFFLGYLLHLILDMFTREGICLFWPLWNKKISLFPIKAGSLVEEIIFVLVLLFDFYLVWMLFF